MVADNSRKYPTWGHFLKSKRAESYRSAREFCSKESVGISYPQYSRYEAGDQLPNLDQAIRLCRLLDIPVLTGILYWAKAQIGDPEALSQVESFVGQLETGDFGPRSSSQGSGPPMSLDDVFIFNRSHLKLFQAEPLYRDLFSLINTYPGQWVSVEQLSQVMELPADKVIALAEQLHEHGVLSRSEAGFRASKRNFYYPDDEEFFELRNQNLAYNVGSIMGRLQFEDLQKRRAFRSVLTVQLTESKRREMIAELEQTLEKALRLQEASPEAKMHSLCLVLGERYPVGRSELPSQQAPYPKGLAFSMHKAAEAASSDA